MANKTLLIGSVLAAALLTACSSSNTTATTTSSTTSTPSATSTSSTAETTESIEDTTPASSGSVAPAELDDQTAAWFTTFCGALGGIQTSVMSAMAGATAGASTDGAMPSMSPQEGHATFVALYTGIGNGFKEAAAAIGAVPPPTIQGGDQVASSVVTGFGTVGDSILAATQQFAATAVSDQASLEAAQAELQAALESSLNQVGTSLQGMESAVAPDVQAAVEALPGCSVLATS